MQKVVFELPAIKKKKKQLLDYILGAKARRKVEKVRAINCGKC